MEIDPALLDLVRYFLIGLGVLAVLGVAVWAAKYLLLWRGVALFAGRQKRIGVVETAMIDGRRRLLLVRRDNVEHLIMTGGPIDVVIENGIHAHGPSDLPVERKEPAQPRNEERILIAAEEEALAPHS